ncbi:MAG: 4Fe-4S binding protein [Methanomassiliicoccaceae archaeon]|jgi:NAD-dependent dihydropyrimidine dehydrogenase PreA subunit|nr:4Fe-4S binding protein [Methanomassiliicoccaceae archaeon]
MRYLKNVVTLELNTDKCLGCGRCWEVCPHGVFEPDDMKARIKDRDKCMECGACAKNCPLNAISVKSGVGCATAIIKGMLTGKEPSCGCSDSDCC